MSEEFDKFVRLAKQLVRVPKEAVTAQQKATRPQPHVKTVKRPKT